MTYMTYHDGEKSTHERLSQLLPITGLLTYHLLASVALRWRYECVARMAVRQVSPKT